MLRFLGCVTVILILHCTGKNAILGKLKLTAVYLTGFRRSRKKMELKQLEYFTIVCEKGSFSQAAECLYTSQPNVSKVISSLEKELGRKLVERSSRGLRITPYGETVRDYAKVILKHASLISSMATHHNGKKFTLATYPSNMITNLLVDFYRHWGRESTLSSIRRAVSKRSATGWPAGRRKSASSILHSVNWRRFGISLDIRIWNLNRSM